MNSSPPVEKPMVTVTMTADPGFSPSGVLAEILVDGQV
jgi:hypothetical protein